MNFKCHNKECGKEFSAQQMIGTVPPHVPLNAYCEPCFNKLVEEKTNKKSA
jgi:hypothetical protein